MPRYFRCSLFATACRTFGACCITDAGAGSCACSSASTSAHACSGANTSTCACAFTHIAGACSVADSLTAFAGRFVHGLTSMCPNIVTDPVTIFIDEQCTTLTSTSLGLSGHRIRSEKHE